MIITLRDAIKTKLEAMVQTDGTRKIVVVYNYPELKPSGYPYAYVLYKGDNSDALTNTEERVIYTYEINTIQEKFEVLKGRADAETTAMTLACDIAEAFRNANDLDTAGVLNIRPIKTEKTYVDNATRIALKTTLEVETIETITF